MNFSYMDLNLNLKQSIRALILNGLSLVQDTQMNKSITICRFVCQMKKCKITVH